MSMDGGKVRETSFKPVDLGTAGTGDVPVGNFAPEKADTPKAVTNTPPPSSPPPLPWASVPARPRYGGPVAIDPSTSSDVPDPWSPAAGPTQGTTAMLKPAAQVARPPAPTDPSPDTASAPLKLKLPDVRANMGAQPRPKVLVGEHAKAHAVGWGLGSVTVGAIAGGVVGGPPGAIVGGCVGFYAGGLSVAGTKMHQFSSKEKWLDKAHEVTKARMADYMLRRAETTLGTLPPALRTRLEGISAKNWTKLLGPLVNAGENVDRNMEDFAAVLMLLSVAPGCGRGTANAFRARYGEYLKRGLQPIEPGEIKDRLLQSLRDPAAGQGTPREIVAEVGQQLDQACQGRPPAIEAARAQLIPDPIVRTNWGDIYDQLKGQAGIDRMNALFEGDQAYTNAQWDELVTIGRSFRQPWKESDTPQDRLGPQPEDTVMPKAIVLTAMLTPDFKSARKWLKKAIELARTRELPGMTLDMYTRGLVKAARSGNSNLDFNSAMLPTGKGALSFDGEERRRLLTKIELKRSTLARRTPGQT